MFSDFETQCEYHQTEPTAYMAGNSIAARYLPGGELITILGFSFRHYRYFLLLLKRKHLNLIVNTYQGLVKVGSRSCWIQKTTFHQMR